MIPSQFWILGFVGATILIFSPSVSGALNCFVCKDCETNFTSSHVEECRKSTARCIKIVYLNGVVDRACGDTNKCPGRDRLRRSILENDDEVDATPHHRERRGLLQQGPTSKELNGVKEASSLHCCSEHECNMATSQLASSSLVIMLPFSLIILLLHRRY